MHIIIPNSSIIVRLPLLTRTRSGTSHRVTANHRAPLHLTTQSPCLLLHQPPVLLTPRVICSKSRVATLRVVLWVCVDELYLLERLLVCATWVLIFFRLLSGRCVFKMFPSSEQILFDLCRNLLNLNGKCLFGSKTLVNGRISLNIYYIPVLMAHLRFSYFVFTINLILF